MQFCAAGSENAGELAQRLQNRSQVKMALKAENYSKTLGVNQLTAASFIIRLIIFVSRKKNRNIVRN